MKQKGPNAGAFAAFIKAWRVREGIDPAVALDRGQNVRAFSAWREAGYPGGAVPGAKPRALTQAEMIEVLRLRVAELEAGQVELWGAMAQLSAAAADA